MTTQFRNLVFEGGGVKGIAYGGALAVLEEKGITERITRVAGTSAGAITAAFVACGLGAAAVGDILRDTDFRRFMDDSFLFGRDVKRLVKEYGWYKGDEFTRWLRARLKDAAGDAEITFRGLARRAAEGKARYLYVVGTDLHAQEARVFGHETTPDVPVAHAVRVSMSIPLFFRAVVEKPRVMVDGGVSWNYPLDLFDDRKYVENPKAAQPVNYPTTWGAGHVFNKETLGLRVDTADEIRAEKTGKRVPMKINNLKDYAAALLGFMMDSANRAHLHRNDWHRTVFLDALGVRTTDFSLSDARVRALVQSGRDGAEHYFRWFEGKIPGAEPPLNKV